jgi:hypothetical protein
MPGESWSSTSRLAKALGREIPPRLLAFAGDR